jgi:predicted kinase
MMAHLKVIVVTGPPCSGKSTYVRTHRGPDDLVIEMDQIKQALGSPPHDETKLRVGVACEALDAIMRRLNRFGYPATVWYVACDPKPADLARIMGTVTRVNLSASIEECKRRASEERPAFWLSLIDKHFASNPK